MSMAGIPLLVGFASHLYAWEVLAEKSLAMAFWILVGNVGLFMGILKMLRSLIQKPPVQGLTPLVSRSQKFLIILGGGALIVFGIFPQWLQFFWTKLPTIFLHLTQ